MRRFLVLSIVLAVGSVGLGVAAAVVAIADRDASETSGAGRTTTPTSAGPLRLAGVATVVTAEEATAAPVPSPFTVQVPARGEGAATIVKVTVGGKPATVAWDGGRPLAMSGGQLDVGITRFEAVAGRGLRWLLDGEPRRLTEATWTVRAPVAVGIDGQGLAVPREGVTFRAGPESLLQTKGGAFVELAVATYTVEGAGSVHLEGDLVVGGRRRKVVDLAATKYRLVLTPTANGFRLAGEVEEPPR